MATRTHIACAWPYYRQNVRAAARAAGCTATPHGRKGCKHCTGMGAATGAGWHYAITGTPAQLARFAQLRRTLP